MAVTDLKYEILLRYAPASKQEGIANVHRQNYLFSDNGKFSISSGIEIGGRTFR